MAPSEVTDSCDCVEEPYVLCGNCQQRLHARALRPLEWYNLVKRHGHRRYLLHDDFYDEDGKAYAPEEDLVDTERHPAPRLEDVKHDVRLLLDFTITRWRLQDEVSRVWEAAKGALVMSELSLRWSSTRNQWVRETILSVCGTQKALGESFVRYAWGDYPEALGLFSLAQASAACLPFHEGLNRVCTAVSEQKGQEKRDAIRSLAYFHTPDVLDWIEHHYFDPLTESWGYLAAASKLDWPRVGKWLASGRPLSLIAIDALSEIAEPRTPLVKKYAPHLIAPPDLDTFHETLINYAKRDPVPRVQQRISYVLTKAAELCAPIS